MNITDTQLDAIRNDIDALRYQNSGGIVPVLVDLSKISDNEWKDKLFSSTFEDIFNSTPVSAEFVIPPFLAKGKIALLSGPQKLGKTRFVLSLIKAAIEERNYFGYDQSPLKVLYLSEMDEKGFGKYLRDYSISDKACTFSFFANMPEVPWAKKVELIYEKASTEKVDLIVFDTLFRWAGISDDQTNDYSAMNTAMEPLIRAKKHNIATLAVHHTRKSGGVARNRSLGSVAISGSVDDLIMFDGVPKSNDRYVVEACGRTIGADIRFGLQENPVTIFSSYSFTASSTDETKTSLECAVISALSDGSQFQMNALMAKLQELGTPYSKKTIQVELKRLIVLGIVTSNADKRPKYSLVEKGN